MCGLDPKTFFRGKKLNDVDFSRTNLSGYDLRGASLEGCKWRKSYISETVFDAKQLSRPEIKKALAWSKKRARTNQFFLKPSSGLEVLKNLFTAPSIGIQLGVSEVFVYIKGRNIVLNEPSIVAYSIKNGRREIFAIGSDAPMMRDRTSGHIEVVSPMQGGMIMDFEAVESMIEHFIKKSQNRRYLIRPQVVISIPSWATAVERRAIQDSGVRAGARIVYLIAEPVVVALGAGLPISEPSGSMVVNICGGTTEVSVLSLDGIVYLSSVRVGSDTMDGAIIQYVRRTTNLLLGDMSAEHVRKEIGSAQMPEDNEGMTTQIKGRNLMNGAPQETRVTEAMIAEALFEPVEQIVEVVKNVLESIPPELAVDILDKGIVLTGGGALLRNLDAELRNRTGLPVSIADNPLSCTIDGISLVIDNFEKWKSILLQDTMFPERQKFKSVSFYMKTDN
ncbi:MAG: rod shape-determining protein [Robiginitomaculum sp.]|nr:MAG: rod shape-determining protein [Robiginitomaculum sp.]